LAAFVGFFLIAQPQPAHAYWCDNCSTIWEQVAEWGKTIAQYAATAQEWILDHFLWASGASSNVAGQTAQARGQLIAAQAGVDAVGQLPNKQFTTQYTVDRTLLTGNKLCYATMEGSAVAQVEEARKAMLTAFELSFTQVGAGGDDPTAHAARVKFKCDEAFLDSSDTSAPNGGNLLKNSGCPAASHNRNFVGKHRDPNSVVGVSEYYMPANTTTSKANGLLLTLPTAAMATDTEMPAIAALAYCMLRHGHTATSVSLQKSSGLTALAEFDEQDDEKGGANVSSQSCLEQVVDRMAVGSGAIGDQLQQVYVAQASLCQYMYKLGKLTSTENENCMSNGMSYINAQIHMHCKSGRPDWVVTRIGQGPTGDAVIDEVGKGGDVCTQYKDQVAASAHAFIQSMQTADRTPTKTVTTQEAR
jgi:hypothetical protein